MQMYHSHSMYVKIDLGPIISLNVAPYWCCVLDYFLTDYENEKFVAVKIGKLEWKLRLDATWLFYPGKAKEM